MRQPLNPAASAARGRGRITVGERQRAFLSEPSEKANLRGNFEKKRYYNFNMDTTHRIAIIITAGALLLNALAAYYHLPGTLVCGIA